MTERTCLPLAVIYCIGVTMLAVWCELRGDFRQIRTVAPGRARRASSRCRRARSTLWLARPTAFRIRSNTRRRRAKLHACGVALSVWTARPIRTVDGDGFKLNAAPTALPRIG